MFIVTTYSSQLELKKVSYQLTVCLMVLPQPSTQGNCFIT